MRITDVVMVVMVIGLVFTIFALTIQDVKELYPEQNMTGNISAEYEFSESINSSVAPLKEKMANIESSDKGWKIFVAVAAIPTFITSFFSIIFNVFAFVTTLIVGFAKELKIPLAVSGIVIAMVSVYLILKMVEWWKGTSK